MADVLVRRRSGSLLVIAIGIGLLTVTTGAGVSVGAADLDVGAVWSVVLGRVGIADPELSGPQAAIVWELRLPRVVGAMIVGAGLALCGTVMQTLMRNPLADPYLLGLSSGAGVGAVVVIVLGLAGGPLALSVGAFVGALGALLIVLALAGARGGRLSPTRTILAGVAVAALCGAVSAFLLVVAAEGDSARRLMAWSFGALGGLRWNSVGIALGVLVAVTVIVLANARSLNAFTFGEQLAGSLGVRVQRARWLLLSATALLTAVLVAICGAIGFVGLVVPHAVSFLTPYDHRLRIPITMIAGGLFLSWVDVLARVTFAPRDMPIGVMTAMIGVPLFIWLLHRNRRL